MRLVSALVPIIAVSVVLTACSSKEETPITPGDAGDTTDGSGASDGDTQGDGSTPGGADGGAPDLGIADDCNPITQMGCSAPTSKCVVENPTPMGGTQCVEPGTDAPENAACTGNDCQPGLACVNTSSTAVCQRVCDFHGVFSSGAGCEALGDEFECRTRLTGTNWGVCMHLPPICSPLTQEPCAQDSACAPFVRRSGAWEFRCRDAGLQMEGRACGSTGMDCQRGLVCVKEPSATEAVCRKYCSSNTDCVEPEMCAGSVSEPPFMFCNP